MSERDFEWVGFYAELAGKLSKFKDNRKGLVVNVVEIVECAMKEGVNTPALEDGSLEDIDPFTVFALFNRGLNGRNRRTVAGIIKDKFSIRTDVPESYGGVPVLDSRNFRFYKDRGERNADDIELLWRLFSAAMEHGQGLRNGLAAAEEKGNLPRLFERALKINGIGVGKMTSALYWIAPDAFLNLDRTNRSFIYDSGEIPWGVVKRLPRIKSGHNVTWDKYSVFVDGIRAYLYGDGNKHDWKDFKGLSLAAWDYVNGSGGADAGNVDAPDVTDVDAYGPVGRNVIYYGVPGAGKSHEVEREIASMRKRVEGEGRVLETERVVFHPDYAYSDFVGQILPKTTKEKPGEDGKVTYEFSLGPFTRILEKAVNNEENVYCLVIEEINRGNAPAVFGDMFQLLDRDKGGDSVYSVTNDEMGKRIYGSKDEEIHIPSNLFIFATMNTSDQNVFTLDTAFQRRWEMRLVRNEIELAPHAKYKIWRSGISWGTFVSIVNGKIADADRELGSTDDKRLGAYFVCADEDGKEGLGRERFPEKVLRYLWDDAFRNGHDEMFRDGLRSLEDVVKAFEDAAEGEDSLGNVLRDDVFTAMRELEARAEPGGGGAAGDSVDDRPGAGQADGDER